MEENRRPSNKFREEIEKEQVSEEELMLRDQIIMARAMEANHTLAKFNQEYLEHSFTELLLLQSFMQSRPVSPGLTALTEAARVQVEGAKKALEPPVVSRADLVQLAALKAAILLKDISDDPVMGAQIGEPYKDSIDIKADIEDDGLGRGDEDQDALYKGMQTEEEEHEMVDPNEVPVKLDS